MNPFEEIAKISPLSIVDLKQINLPASGLFMTLNHTCQRNYKKKQKCQEFYRLLSRPINFLTIKQCPYGFAAYPFRTRNCQVAFTGFIPFPRLGGASESAMAKAHPETKISTENLDKCYRSILEVDAQYKVIEMDALKSYAMALHEIRKLNRNVKQIAERLCNRECPAEPDCANPDLVKIWKTADLMSNQFDIIEILANESQTDLPCDKTSEIYKIFDKCMRIYEERASARRRLTIWAPKDYHPRTKACNKTFPIVATVLIENALKYSINDSVVAIAVAPERDNICKVTVVNNSIYDPDIDERIFLKGTRASKFSEGSGNGLYVAQLVAKQHGTRIEFESSTADNKVMKCTFSVRFNTI